MSAGLYAVPITQREALAFIERHHRHNPPPRGAKVCIGAALDGDVVGVVTLGRPSSRVLDDGWTAEVTRCCTDGTRNACSFLYGAAWRAAKAMGYRRVVTYTMQSEPGSSLRAAGFDVVAEVQAKSWHCKSRPRVDTHPIQPRLRWERT